MCPLFAEIGGSDLAAPRFDNRSTPDRCLSHQLCILFPKATLQSRLSWFVSLEPKLMSPSQIGNFLLPCLSMICSTHIAISLAISSAPSLVSCCEVLGDQKDVPPRRFESGRLCIFPALTGCLRVSTGSYVPRCCFPTNITKSQLLNSRDVRAPRQASSTVTNKH